jgi:hypothetical protein
MVGEISYLAIDPIIPVDFKSTTRFNQTIFDRVKKNVSPVRRPTRCGDLPPFRDGQFPQLGTVTVTNKQFIGNHSNLALIFSER